MGIQCRFTDFKLINGELVYGCKISNKQTPENRDLELIGSHENGKTNNDVVHVQFENCTITKVPQGLTAMFPNMTSLVIHNSKLKKISKEDLEEYKNLKSFYFSENDLEFLPGDLFEDFENLEFIDFSGNDLKVIEPNILDGLNQLKHFNLGDNDNYDNCFSVYPDYDSNATLQEIKSDLYEKFFMRLKFLDNLRKSKRNLKLENRQLTSSNARLKQENEEVKNSNVKLEERVARLELLESVRLCVEQAKNVCESVEMLISTKTQSNLATSVPSNSTHKTQSTLTTDLINFIKDETTKDFKIKISDREFPVHKFLLAARSPTLTEILRNNPEVENLNLVDISVEIFEKILKFLYTDGLPCQDRTNFLQLFAAAGKLKIKELKNFAASKLSDQINEENVIEIFNLSNKYGHDELKQKAFGEIKKKFTNIRFKDEWMNKPEKLLQIIEKFKRKEEAKRKYEEEIRKLDEQFEQAMMKY